MLGKYSDEYYEYILNGVEPDNKSKKAIFDIISDLTDRNGVGNEFEAIDDDIQEEIVKKWINIVENTK